MSAQRGQEHLAPLASGGRRGRSAAVRIRKSLEEPDETRVFDHGKVEIVRVKEDVVGKFTLQPGWRWSEHEASGRHPEL